MFFDGVDEGSVTCQTLLVQPQWQSLTAQKTRIYSNTAVSTSYFST